ncbi:host attachment protein [Janthinobacterium sp. ZB1P44]|uniref:host attachment protein n=1 Tax=Janthinobacterium sp. ZB1P44 TaxID=3424192 RepID=UPI003F26D5E8
MSNSARPAAAKTDTAACQPCRASRRARHIAQLLQQGLQQRRYNKLCLVAAPKFLGRLRKAWTPRWKGGSAMPWPGRSPA